MTISRNPVNSSMQPRRDHSSGWAAFDRKQREKQGTEPASDLDPFPSIASLASSCTAEKFIASQFAPVKTSSIVRPPLQSQLTMGNCKGAILQNSANEKHKNKQITPETSANALMLLCDIHSWAEHSLIEDVLAAVDNDVDQASILLKTMVSSDMETKEPTLSGASSSSVSYLCDSKSNFSGESGLVQSKSDGAHQVIISRQLFSVPAEPEWEEDDIYLSHRKDALKMMRVASQHSRAASNAFMRGDHVSAHYHSARAREEWMAAEKLNAKAAEEILRIRNIDNDVWKLDLHGLHATEAVSALKEHLHKIESRTMMKHSTSDEELTMLDPGVRRSPLESLSLDVDINTRENKALPHQRRSVLDVITGKGNHSRCCLCSCRPPSSALSCVVVSSGASVAPSIAAPPSSCLCLQCRPLRLHRCASVSSVDLCASVVAPPSSVSTFAPPSSMSTSAPPLPRLRLQCSVSHSCRQTHFV